MITLRSYPRVLGEKHIGNVHKIQSDIIEEYTWNNEIESRIAYFYDWNHDTHHTQLTHLHPEQDEYKVPMDIKYIVASKQTLAKDAITYHLQLRPSQQCVVDYYNECFGSRYNAEYPVGLYCDIQDSKGVWNRWLVCATANINDPQFPNFEILRCDYVLDAIFDNIQYKIPIVLRSQNSYNSGLWVKYHVETVEDQGQFIVPLNRLTERIWYNVRFLIDAKIIQDECRAWHVSKVNRIDLPGCALITLAQDHFNPETDYIEKDIQGNTIGLWADYYKQPVTPTPFNPSPIQPTGVITCVGSQEIKVGGSYKKFTIDFYDEEGVPLPFKEGTWSFWIDNTEIEPVISTSSINANQIKAKLPNNGLWINKIMTVKYTTNDAEPITTEFNISVVSL